MLSFFTSSKKSVEEPSVKLEQTVSVNKVPILKSSGSSHSLVSTAEQLNAEHADKLAKFRSMKPWSFDYSSIGSHHAEEHSMFEDIPDLPSFPDDYWRKHFEDYCDDKCLVRYLKANGWKVESAHKQLVSTLDWRRRYQPHLISPDEVEFENKTGKMYVNGFSKNGEPIMYVRPHLENSKDNKRKIRNLVFNLEYAIKLMPENGEKLMIIFDFRNYNPANAPPLSQTKYFLHLVTSHYPERLAAALGCDAPWYFWVVYKVIQPVISPVTREKIKFVDTATMKTCKDNEKGVFVNLLNYVDENILEADFGGKQKFVYDHETYWKSLRETLSI